MADDLPPTHQPDGGQQPPPYPQNPYEPQQPAQPYGAQPGDQYGQYGAPPGQPPGSPTPDDRNWASAAHWGAFVAGFVALAFLAPLLIMLLKGPQSPFVRRHAVESLNFQISLLIYSIGGGIAAILLTLATFGLGLLVVLPLLLALMIFVIVVMIQASIKAANGEDYHYPLTLRLVS